MLGIDLKEELDVGLVEAMEVLETADQVQVDPPGVASGASGLEVTAKEEIIGVLEIKTFCVRNIF